MKKLTKQQKILQMQTGRLLVFAIVVTLVCAAIWYGLARAVPSPLPQRMVMIYDRGVERSIITTATTVESALRVAGITVDPNDTIEPVASTKLTDSRFNIIIYRSRPVAIVDGSIRQISMTPKQSANGILTEIDLQPLQPNDKVAFTRGNLLTDGAQTKLTITRHKVAEPEEVKPTVVAFVPKPNALTKFKGAHVYVDDNGVAHRETYYDLPMNIVMQSCGAGGSYSVRPEDGAKVDQDGYILVAANLNSYPRCTIVDTSMGPGKVYDTGGFAVRHPYGFDLATDWTRSDGI